MTYSRYRNTTLASINLADSVTGLLAKLMITPEVASAAEVAPFRFDPVADAAFFQDCYWHIALEEQILSSRRLYKRFHRWYDRAELPKLIYITIAALTDSDDAIDFIIDDAREVLVKRHRMDIIDNDDSIVSIPDYHAVRDPFNIANAFNNEMFEWWKSRFEAQAHRVLQVPTMPFDNFQLWNMAREDQNKLIKDHFRQNLYARIGTSERDGRKMLVRSLRLFASLFGDVAVRQFVKGKPLKIRGHYFEWELQMNPKNIMTYTVCPPTLHVPYSMVLNDLDGNRLANACVVFKDTPVLDQAVSIGLSVANREDEFDLLQTTNIFHVTKIGLENENLRYLTLPGLNRNNEIPSDRSLEERYREIVIDVDDVFEPQLVPVPTGDEPEPEPEPRMVDMPGRVVMIGGQLVDRLDTIVQIPDRVLNTEGVTVNRRLAKMYHNMMLHQARIRKSRDRDPIASRIRAELFRRLDIRPDVLDYMAYPEFHFSYLFRLKQAPRLVDFIERKTPLTTRLNLS